MDEAGVTKQEPATNNSEEASAESIPQKREECQNIQEIWSTSVQAEPSDLSDSCRTESLQEIRKKPKWRRYLGLGCGVLASMCFSLSVILVKYLKEYDPMSVGVFRFGGVIVSIIPIVLYYECQPSKGVRIFETVWPLTKKENRIQFARVTACGILGGAAALIQLYSLHYITVADSSAIAYASPVCVVILAHFLLKEKCGVISIVVALITCVGVFIIARPPVFTGAHSFDKNAVVGVAIALCAMLSNASLYIVMRDARKVHFTLVSIAMTIGGVAESLTTSLISGTLKLPEGPRDIVLMTLILPAVVFTGQVAATLALKFEQAGPVALVRTSDVLFSFCWQYIFLGVVPDIFSLAGAAIVVSGVVITAMRKWLVELPPENKQRQRFSFLLI